MNCKCDNQEDCTTECSCAYQREIYPQITDHILLEFICIANKYYIDIEGTNIETMKNSLLENFIFFRRDVKEDICTLFEEGNNNDR